MLNTKNFVANIIIATVVMDIKYCIPIIDVSKNTSAKSVRLKTPRLIKYFVNFIVFFPLFSKVM